MEVACRQRRFAQSFVCNPAHCDPDSCHGQPVRPDHCIAQHGRDQRAGKLMRTARRRSLCGERRVLLLNGDRGQRATFEEEIAVLECRQITGVLARMGNNHTHAARELGLSRVGLL